MGEKGPISEDSSLLYANGVTSFNLRLPRRQPATPGALAATEVEAEYERRWKAMSPAERFARTAAMFAWTRQQMARQIRHEEPSLSDEELRWRVALKLYAREPEVVKLIHEHLDRVSR